MSLITNAPITKSECPPKYFVALWYTISAPSNNGDWITGLQNVLSTTDNMLCFLAIERRFYKSKTFIVGLVGVSTHISLVSGLIAFYKFYTSVKSIN